MVLEVRQRRPGEPAGGRIAGAGLGLELGDVLAVIGNHGADEFTVEARAGEAGEAALELAALGLDHAGIDSRVDTAGCGEGILFGGGMVVLEGAAEIDHAGARAVLLGEPADGNLAVVPGDGILQEALGRGGTGGGGERGGEGQAQYQLAGFHHLSLLGGRAAATGAQGPGSGAGARRATMRGADGAGRALRPLGERSTGRLRLAAMASLVLNDQPVAITADPAMPLLWALRDLANLTGSKYGCGVGECGACMVLVDGQPLPSCTLTMAEAEGRSVTTIEGLARRAPGTPRHPVLQALIDEQAIQCGFCTPGLAIALAGLLARNPRPSDEEIAQAVTNLCRCGVYPRIVPAVRRITGPVVAPAPAAAAAPEEPGAETGDAAAEPSAQAGE